MRIAQLDAIPYALPFREPYATARGTLARREMVLLRIRNEDGVEGLGEAVPLSLRGGASLAQVAGELHRLAVRLVGAEWHEDDPLGARDPLLADLSPPALCAVVTARLDLEAKVAGVPAWKMLGARAWDTVTCNATISAGTPAEVAARATEWAGDGFRTFKLKVGGEHDVECVRALREAIGAEAKIRLDANGAWSVRAAAKTLTALDGLGVELVEQPVSSLRKMAKLRRGAGVRIAADESVATVAEAERAVAMGACDMATVKLSKVGGHVAALEIAERLPVYISSALDGPVGIAAAAHLSQALRGRDAAVAHGLATQRLFADTIASRACELSGDQLRPPPGPGLGVEIDDDALTRCRL
jgi:L-Ala-D/L-Glu epimerase / N-acetyl-D-glutamate racemase